MGKRKSFHSFTQYIHKTWTGNDRQQKETAKSAEKFDLRM